MESDEETLCEWKGCTSPAVVHLSYGFVRQNYCEMHRLQVKRAYAFVKESPVRKRDRNKPE